MTSREMRSLLMPPSRASWDGMGSRQYTFNPGFSFLNSVITSL